MNKLKMGMRSIMRIIRWVKGGKYARITKVVRRIWIY